MYPSPADSHGRPTPVSHLPRGFAFPGPPLAQAAGPYSVPQLAPPAEIDPFYNPSMHPSRASEKKSKSKKADGKQPTFLTKLYAILEQPEYHHIIRWDEAGETIIIERPDELAQKIYGWMRKVSLRHVERGIVDPDASTWSHPFLKRDSKKEEILGFKRRVPPRPSQAQRHLAAVGGLSPLTDDGGEYSSPNNPYRHLIPDYEEGMTYIDTPPPSHNQHHFPPLSASYEQYEIGHMLPPSRPIPIEMKGFDIQNDPFYYPSIGGVPQSAPPTSQGFDHEYAIERGHARTRSVQGEPPSATLGSPVSASFAGQGWGGAEPFRSPDLIAAYNPDDATTWARRGQATFGTAPFPSTALGPAGTGNESIDYASMRPPAAIYAHDEAAQGASMSTPPHGWTGAVWSGRPFWHTPTKSERHDQVAPYDVHHGQAAVPGGVIRGVGGPSRLSLDSLGESASTFASASEASVQRAPSADSALERGSI
ncbi:hypothetical protein Q5752_001849 [Cryptotrichosporon argae]